MDSELQHMRFGVDLFKLKGKMLGVMAEGGPEWHDRIEERLKAMLKEDGLNPDIARLAKLGICMTVIEFCDNYEDEMEGEEPSDWDDESLN